MDSVRQLNAKIKLYKRLCGLTSEDVIVRFRGEISGPCGPENIQIEIFDSLIEFIGGALFVDTYMSGKRVRIIKMKGQIELHYEM